MTLQLDTLTSKCFILGVAYIVLILTFNACSSDVPLGPADVEFPATDGTLLRGHHYGVSDITVILAHMSDSNQDAWKEFAVSLNGHGYPAFSFNFRGFKPSKGKKETHLIYRDLEGAIEYLESQGVKSIFIIGAGMGGTAAIKVAAHRDTTGVVAISAPSEIDGLSAEEEAKLVAGAKLFFAAEGDKSAQDSAGVFYHASKSPKLYESFSGNEHGMDLLYGRHAVNIQHRIIEFIGGFVGSVELR